MLSPAVVAVVDVGLDDIGCYITHASKEFPRTPKMAFTEMPAQPGMLAEEPVGAAVFKQLKCFRNAQVRGQSNKQVDVVGFNPKLEYFHIMVSRTLAQKKLTMFADNRKLERVLSVFRLPHEVERVLSNSMAAVGEFLNHFFTPPRIFLQSSRYTDWFGLGAPASLRTQFLPNSSVP